MALPTSGAIELVVHSQVRDACVSGRRKDASSWRPAKGLWVWRQNSIHANLLLPSTDGCVRDYGTIRPMTDASCFYCLTDPNHKSVLVPAVTLWKGTALCADCASVTAANEKVWVS